MTTQSRQKAGLPGNKQHQASLCILIPKGDDGLMIFRAYVTRVVFRSCTQVT